MALAGDTLALGVHSEDSAATGTTGNQDDNSAMDCGAVYVFHRTGTAWQQEAYLKASNTSSAQGCFGTSVALTGDLLAVGVPGEDSVATDVNGDQADDPAVDSGAVYVFRRTGLGTEFPSPIASPPVSHDVRETVFHRPGSQPA